MPERTVRVPLIARKLKRRLSRLSLYSGENTKEHSGRNLQSITREGGHEVFSHVIRVGKEQSTHGLNRDNL